jgi:hypothetical protein
MIVKKVPAKKATKSSYKALANYILDKSNDMEKVESYWFTNCSYTEIDHNVLEIENMQQLNQRAKQDKTYHLIVSFDETENPSEEVLQDIEEELLKSIGLEDCQRLSVVHGNTNNKHIHIAINLIDPHTLKYTNTSFDKLTLQRRAAELEKKHNLVITNHVKKTPEEKASELDDKTIHTGMINFKDWVKETVTEDIKKIIANDKSTWKDLYECLAKYDLELREHGNGYVISSKSQKLFIKASDVHRELSKGKLNKRYGEINKEILKATIEETTPISKFGEKTILKSSLWDEYREKEKQKDQDKRLALINEKKDRLKVIDLINKKWQLQRDKTMKNKSISRLEKQKIYKMIKESKTKEIEAARDRFKEQRNNAYTDYKKISFKDFLINKALEGDQDALKSIRKQKTSINPSDNTLSAVDKKENNQIFTFGNKMVNKDGSITYNIDEKSKVIDKGDHLKVSINNNKSNEILTTLKMAIAKYGNELDITGTESFKREVLKAVKEHNLDVSFSDKSMQQVNQAQRESIENEQVKSNIRKGVEFYLVKVLEEKEKLEDNKTIVSKDKAAAIKAKELEINRLYKLYKKTTTNATYYAGDLKKIGFENKEIDGMTTYKVDIKVNGFIKDQKNLLGLEAMNKEILKKLEEKISNTTDSKKLSAAKEELERYNKFLFVFDKTDKINDMTLSYYDNRKIDVDKFVKEYRMEVSKLDKQADAIKIDDKLNSKQIAEMVKNINLTNEQKNKVSFAIERARREEEAKQAINL